MRESKQAIYIAGHNGFIGSNIKKALTARNVDFLELNHLDEIRIMSKDAVLINLVGRGMVRDKEESISEIFDANYEKALTFAKACAASNWKLVHLGSYPADYGDSGGPYYESKKKASQEIKKIVEERDLTILSPDIVVGQNNNSFPCRAYLSLKENQNLVIENPGVVRNFIKVEDLSKKVVDHILNRDHGIITPVLSSTNWRIDHFFQTLHTASKIYGNNNNFSSKELMQIQDQFMKLEHMSVLDLPIAFSILDCIKYMEGANA